MASDLLAIRMIPVRDGPAVGDEAAGRRVGGAGAVTALPPPGCAPAAPRRGGGRRFGVARSGRCPCLQQGQDSTAFRAGARRPGGGRRDAVAAARGQVPKSSQSGTAKTVSVSWWTVSPR